MDRYINADKLIKDLNLARIIQKPHLLDYEETIEIIKMSATEIEETKLGEWVEHKDYYNHGWVCSACGNYGHENKEGRPCFSEFCPNCGADMRNDKKVINQL